MYPGKFLKKVGSFCLLFTLLTLFFLPSAYPSSDLDKHINSLANGFSEFTRKLKSDTRVAVLPVYKEDSDEITKLGRYFQESVSNSLISEGKLIVVNRQRLKKILEEIEFQLSDLVDSRTRRKIGRFTGADLIFIGSYWDMGHEVKISAQLYEVGSADAIAASDCFVDKRLIPPAWDPDMIKVQPVVEPEPVPEPEPTPEPKPVPEPEYGDDDDTPTFPEYDPPPDYDDVNLLPTKERIFKILEQFGEMNIPLKTMGGKTWWNTIRSYNGWKLQQHKITKHCRILDPENYRRAWGNVREMKKAWDAAESYM